MEASEIKVKLFDTRHFNVTGLAVDLWKVVTRFLIGFIDSCRLDHLFRLLEKEPRLAPILRSCFLLNITYLIVMVVVENILTYLLEWRLTDVAGDDYLLNAYKQLCTWSLWIVYQLTWAVPMFGASFLRSNKYYAELAELVPAPLTPRAADRSAQSGNTLVSHISDGLSFVLQLILLKVANSVVGAIPYSGWYLSAILQCLLASFYAFESHWARIHPGQPPGTFIAFIERDWAYFFGFGVLLTATTIALPVFMSLALYAAILPVFIIVASRPEAAAWQRSIYKPSFQVLPQSIRYFDMGHKAVDLATIWIKYKLT
jgi:riboflavin transporter FmnP